MSLNLYCFSFGVYTHATKTSKRRRHATNCFMFKGYLPETRHKLLPNQWEYQRSTRLLSKQHRKGIVFTGITLLRIMHCSEGLSICKNLCGEARLVYYMNTLNVGQRSERGRTFLSPFCPRLSHCSRYVLFQLFVFSCHV